MESAGKRKGKRVAAAEAPAARKAKRSSPTSEYREQLVLRVMEKAKLPAREADNLDYKAYNKRKLVMVHKTTLRGFETHCATHRSLNTIGPNQFDGLVLLLEDGVCYGVDVITQAHDWTCHGVCISLKNMHFSVMSGDSTKMDMAGSRAMHINGQMVSLPWVPNPTQPPPLPRGRGCNSSNHNWPFGVMLFGLAQTLPELLHNGEAFLAANSGIRIFVGIKQYELKTEQLVALVLYKKETEGTIAREAISFGTDTLDDSTLQVLENHGIQLRGVGCGDEACDKLGIEAYQLKLPGEATNYDTGHPRTDRTTDLYAVQAWLGNRRDIQPKQQSDSFYTPARSLTPEERKAYNEFVAKPENKGIAPFYNYFMGLTPVRPPIRPLAPGEKHKTISRKPWILEAERDRASLL